MSTQTDMRPHKTLDLSRFFQNTSRQFNGMYSVPDKCLMAFTQTFHKWFRDKTSV